MQIDYISSNGEGVSGHSWTLRSRTLGNLAFPVPSFQPGSPGIPIAMDLMPLGPNPTESPGNGFAWIDVENADVMLNNSAPLTTGRLGCMTVNGQPAGYVGTMTFNGAPSGNFWIVTNGGPQWGVAFNGNLLPFVDNAASVGLPSNRATAVYATNGTIQTSDQREKTDIKPTALGLDFIKALLPVSYRWKRPDSERHQGVIAQNVLAAAGGEPCGVCGDDRLSLNYSELIGPLIKAVQELAAEVDSLRRQQGYP